MELLFGHLLQNLKKAMQQNLSLLNIRQQPFVDIKNYLSLDEVTRSVMFKVAVQSSLI